MSDNHHDECHPFKGPFKGKGQTRKAIQQLEAELASILAEMTQVVDQYNVTFPSTPRPVNLRIHRRPNAHSLLSWRDVGPSGSYLHLFGTEVGHAILARLGPNAIHLLARFDQERLRLNFLSKLIWSALHAHRLHQDGMERQGAWLAQYTTRCRQMGQTGYQISH